MKVDTAALRRRRRRIEEATREQTRQTGSTANVGSGIIPVVIRSTQEEVEQETMIVQRIRYRTQPPIVGELSAVGQLFRAYPYWGSTYELFAYMAWGPDDPIDEEWLMTYPLMAMQDFGSWVLFMPLKGVATVIDPNDPKSGCSG